ncbi:RNA-directed DNA polymerase [Kaistia dalseonensis]|uniref:Reverse transcriptase domain-containing protein n=1 Tax=Kaistia dalseonensis TaxID=410840 RepID=A0ABU0HBM7_9HYPH|nr:RNA-directed DNA polymerase [Kaistia dalseonensis]MCX5497088.1 RNA-directed DNA polymerase [Kaistia dalseonensis]MDQ0439714.1 hypothetical protein [Kaistia dalseonensis]
MTKFIGSDPNIFAEKMLDSGFFPENLPPVFKIENLHEAAIGALSTNHYLTDKPTEGARYNASKRNGQRRIFTMPNPVFMVDCSIFFSEYSSQIDEHLSLSADGPSNPLFNDGAGRPIKINSHPEFHRRRRKDLALSRYVVKTDISRFFHSIYTHSISWALHGKTDAKKDRRDSSETVFGNRLDKIVRQSQDGQTIGIPVGPDFSRLISEIIGVSIDHRFRIDNGGNIPLLRLVDDIYIGADNLDDANSYLSSIRDSIRQFELDINESKTTILESSDDLEPFWPVEIRREIQTFSADDITNNRQSRADFVHFMDEILRAAKIRNDEGIVKFALRKIDDFNIWNIYWDLLEPFLIRSAISFPHCWDYVARVVAWRQRKHGVDSDLWRQVAEKSIARSARSGNDSEVIWALWMLKELGQAISLSLVESIIKRCGPFVVLLCLDVHQSSASTYNFPKDILLDRIGERPMLGSNWILSYEADRQFGFRLKSKNLQGSDFFQSMYDNNTSFYDRSADPVVFENDVTGTSAKNAIEKGIGDYDDYFDDEPDGKEDDEF